MGRPKKSRAVGCVPGADYFKPRGIPTCQLEEERLSLDELEALRLADGDAFYHNEAAQRMRISRATFGRILREARRKVASAILQGKALRIEKSGKKEKNYEDRFSGRKR
jgi:predicted DNA-binding protein (UPF0251 family)